LMQEVAPGLPVVLDPVIAASSGERFLDHAIVEGYCEQLLSLGAIWTPNLPELAELCDVDLGLLESDLEARSAAAERLVAAGARAVLVKGGHGVESPVQDLVLERGVRPYWSRRERLEGRSLRGTGCRYASSLAGRLALGFSLPQAAQEAGEWVAGCIERGG
jgi:hydroxymethylpyrimidine/phosphomethylpyrimidine kinase